MTNTTESLSRRYAIGARVRIVSDYATLAGLRDVVGVVDKIHDGGLIDVRYSNGSVRLASVAYVVEADA